jgi:hypothetical protein
VFKYSFYEGLEERYLNTKHPNEKQNRIII